MATTTNLFIKISAAIVILVAGRALASEKLETNAKPAGPACDVAGPQTPRDIDSKVGHNTVSFAIAPNFQDLNLCNIHFHQNAEHKAKDSPSSRVTAIMGMAAVTNAR